MGLASALTTALTGLTAAETQIDVAGNNLANSQTVGFKASSVLFATQFLQTIGLGSSPTAESGGTNPRQTGLGVQIAEIAPNFTQGTIEISSNQTDLAIQGDGFFVVEGGTGERLYSRNGIFKTNAQNELVTSTGNRVLGYGADSSFQIQRTVLQPLSIPLGTASVAQATENVFMQGNFTPTGDVADVAEVIESATLGNDAINRPDVSGMTINAAPRPAVNGITGASANVAGGLLAPGDAYQYRFAYVDDTGTIDTESLASASIAAPVVGAGDNAITLSARPNAANGYSKVAVYRTVPGGTDFFYLNTVDADGTAYTDDGTTALSSTALDSSTINGNYSYYVTYSGTGLEETRPSLLVGGNPLSVIDGRVHIQNMPTPPALPAGYDTVRVYRNLSNDSNSFYLVSELSPGDSFTDNRSDAAISDLTDPANKRLDLDGPRADATTKLVDLIRQDSFSYEHLFTEGTLEFDGRKGGRQLDAKTFTVTSSTTLQELANFLQDALGIQKPADDPGHPIPGSENDIPGETGTLLPGVTIHDGKLRFVSNNGVDNALGIPLAAFKLKDADGNSSSPNMGFASVQTAKGQSAVADLVAYDSLGIPLNVRITAVLESRTNAQTTYRWFADSSDNDPASGSKISVGTGLVSFDGNGNFITATNDTVSVERRSYPSQSPLEFHLDFSQVSGLANSSSTLAAARQDGSSAGTLTSFIIGEDGTIRGVFSNGVTRDLGQIQLARFANNAGLEQRGNNLFAAGVNSGLPIVGDPGSSGIGSIRAGAVELSNSDIGANLIDLILATTQYRGNSRVITASQQLLDELLNLRQ